MVEVRIHGALWREAVDSVAEEWRRTLRELNASNAIAFVDAAEDPALEIVRPPSGAFVLRLYAEGYQRLAEVDITSPALQAHFEEYALTIRHMVRIDREAPARGFEALDYAKRVVHDEAAAYLIEATQGLLRLNLADARGLFTLLFLVGSDIPAAWVRYHRAH